MIRCRIESMGVSLPGRHLLPWGSMKHALTAGRHCLSDSHYHREDVQVLINSGVHRDGHICEPAMAVYLQHRLGINIEFQGRRTLSFDLLNGGCGMLNAVQVLCSLMQSGEIQAGMAISSEANSDSRPDASALIPASGVALLLDISPQRDIGFGDFSFHTREEYADLYSSIVDLQTRRGRLRMQRSAELEQIYLSMAPGIVEEVLHKENLCRDDITRIIPAQISPAFLSVLPATIGFPQQKVADFSKHLPDTLSTSLFLAFHRSATLQPPNPGEKALLLAFGSGVTVGAGMYYF